ncbi:hypothetical protein [Rhodohalobacter sp. 8-1]|uniref:hypothetical protein n=1 Tax=Rhodohalobacter sp. 8-1 TaxID=3131972 RepID=UPI0030ED9586
MIKKACFTVVIILISVLACKAQEITMETSWFTGHQFSRDGIHIPMRTVENVMQENSEAQALMASARSTNTFGQIVAGVGGFMIGWPIGTAVGGGEPNWAVAGIGAGIAVLSIPIYKSSASKAQQAVELYNKGRSLGPASEFNPDVNVYFSGSGAGLRVSF